MPRLHHLNVSHNLLHELKDETFEKNEELISLDISYNKFEYFSNLSFKGLEVLEVKFDIYCSTFIIDTRKRLTHFVDIECQPQCHKAHHQ